MLICQAPESRPKRNLVVRNDELASALLHGAVVSELIGFGFEASRGGDGGRYPRLE